MPNICMSVYTFHGAEEDLKKLRDTLEKGTSTCYKENDYGNEKWLGNILYEVGLENYITDDSKIDHLNCRGSLTNLSEVAEMHDSDNNVVDHLLVVETSTEWIPNPELMLAVTKVLDINVKYSLLFIDPGLDLYRKFNPDKFIELDGDIYLARIGLQNPDDKFINFYKETYGDEFNKFFDGEKNIFYMNKTLWDDELVSIIQELLDDKSTNLDELMNNLQTKQEEFFARYGEDSFVDIHPVDDIDFEITGYNDPSDVDSEDSENA